MLGRVVIDNVRPRTLTGAYPAKAAVGDTLPVSAWIHHDGHDLLAARVQWRAATNPDDSKTAPLYDHGNDEWAGTLAPTEVGLYELRVEAWVDHVATWAHDVRIKADMGDDVTVELEEGARLLDRLAPYASPRQRARLDDAAATLRRTNCALKVRLAAGLNPEIIEICDTIADPYDRAVSAPQLVWVDRPLARFSAWYELFPRSEGGLDGARKRLPALAEMGFDIAYLPPIHPIGTTARKGRNNTLDAGSDDPGSPWAIGSRAGGHTAIDPALGTVADFERFVAEAAANGLEVALDYALQCSPDHPWVTEHPEWFHHRPDGSIKYAENPPKKYQDIYPINFWPRHDDGTPDDDARQALWVACKDIIDVWIERGVKVFRVDNPHTKPMAFWEWLLPAVRAEHPDVILLSEAFTTPKVMYKLAEIGFTQSYTYFTWRHSRQELERYLDELAHTEVADYFRPNFWPTTPDILSGVLRHGNEAAFKLRAVLAALLSPSWGLYSGYELMENEPASEANEEHWRSEKYEIKRRDWDDPRSLAPFVARLNAIRRAHPALAELRTVRFHDTGKDTFVAFSKTMPDGRDPVLVVVNLDPHDWQETTLSLDLGALGLPWDGDYEVHDELSGQTFTWNGPNPYVRLDPTVAVAHVFSLRTRW